MEPIDPVYGTATLLLIAAGAVALLLVLIMGLKLHAFLSLVLVSVVTAVAVGFDYAEIPDVLLYGFADTIGSVALLVAFGVMLGRLLEVTGGAQVLADTLIGRFGEKRAPFALGVAALIFGFPIFFDAGLVVFLPIILTVARRFGGSLLYYALPAAGAFAAMHAIVPPHPGPVAAAEQINADVGLTLLIGIPIAVVAWYFGSYLVSEVPGQADLRRRGRRGLRQGRRPHDDEADRLGESPPSFGTVLGLLLHPAGADLLRHRARHPRRRRGPRGGDRLGRLPRPPGPDPGRAAGDGARRDLRPGPSERLDGADHHDPGPRTGADLRDHPDHRRRRHVRWRARAQRHRRGSELLALRPGHVADRAGLRHRHRCSGWPRGRPRWR